MTDGKIKAIDERISKQTCAMTNSAYARACKIMGYNNVDLKSKYYNEEITWGDLHRKSEELDEVYRDLVCKFATSVLSNILLIHESGGVQRAKKTLDSIHVELLERELNNEKEGAG